MATKMRNLQALVGERITAVVVAEDKKRHLEHGYLFLDDETHVEIYVNQGGVSQRWPTGLSGALAFIERNGWEVEGVWPSEAPETVQGADHRRQSMANDREHVSKPLAEEIISRIPALRNLAALDSALQRATDGEAGVEFDFDRMISLEDLDRQYAMYVLRRLGGNKTRAAEVLGIDPSTLYRKLARWGIE